MSGLGSVGQSVRSGPAAAAGAAVMLAAASVEPQLLLLQRQHQRYRCHGEMVALAGLWSQFGKLPVSVRLA